MRRLVVMIGLVLTLVACSAPSEGGGQASQPASSAAPAASPASRYDY